MVELSLEDVLESLVMPLKIRGLPVPPIKFEEVQDLVEEFKHKLEQKLNVKPSLLYKLVVCNVVPYRAVPPAIRNLLLRTRKASLDNYIEKLELERIRKEFMKRIGAQKLQPMYLITHDIDTEKGLRRALKLKKVEDKYGVKSIWFIPTGEYKLDKKIVKELAEDHEIGSHDVKHDGKLILLEKEEIVKRLKESKKLLEQIIEKEVKWFRAPLLQHNMKIIQAIKEAGYKYSSTSPAWEPVHPVTMKPYGVELLDPVKVNDVIEIPVTLPQDHQMLHVIGLSSKKSVEKWMNMINELNETAVLLIHPDYELNANHYKNIVKALVEREQCSIAVNCLELL